MKHVRHRRRERAANSQAAEPEGCCRRQARAIKPVTLQVTRSTQSSLHILEQLTMRNISETQSKDPSNYYQARSLGS